MSTNRTAFPWRRIAAYLTFLVAALVALYALAGYVLLPYLIQRMAPVLAAERLQRDLQLHHVDFNPFTWRMTLQGLTLRERQGDTLASVAEVTIDLDAGPLLDREIWLSEVRLIGPWVHLGIAADGELNLARLITDATGGSEKAPEGEPSEPWQFTLERIAIRNGVLHLSDLSGTTPAEADVVPIDLEAQHLSTRAQDTGVKVVALGFGDGGRLTVQGHLALNPPAARGRLTIQDYSPRLAWRFLRDEFDLQQPTGRLNGRADYDFSMAGGAPRLHVSDLQLQLSGLRLQRRAANQPLARLQSLALEDGSFDLDGNRARIGRLRASGGALHAIRHQTLLDWDGIVRGTAAAEQPPNDAPAAPFSVTVDAVEVAEVAIQFEDLDQARPLHVGLGKLSLGFALQAQRQGEGVELQLGDLKAELKQLSLTQADAPDALLTLDRTVLQGGTVDLARTRLALDELQVQGGRVIVERDARGGLNWQRVWTSQGTEADAAAANPWQLSLQRFSLADFGAVVTDRGASKPVTLSLAPIGLQLGAFTSPPQGPMDFRLDATLHEGGRLSAEGQADLAGPSVTADLDLTDITLLPLQAYIADFARVSLNSGRAGLKGRLEFASGNGGARFSGSARVDDLAVTETTGGATLVAWQALQASGLALAPGGLDIKEVALERPAGKFIINPDMTTNWQDTLISTPAKKAAPDRAATPQPDFQVQVGRVRIRDGALNFGDLSLKPQFRSDIHALNGSIAGISTASGARASADLKGRVDEFGSATIKGELQPGAPQEFTDILMAFQNIDLSHLTPYSAKFAGYKINSGKLSLDLGYKVQKAQLQGNNQIIVDKLTLGEKVESPDAINAPLELAIALLEDANGRIEIGLPVSGDLNEPQFSYGHLIWKALGNLITKAISAPFRALAGALGVADEGLDNIAFAPGDAVMSPPEQEKLTTVVKMLAARPKLALEIQGTYSQTADGAAIRTLALHRTLLQRQGVKLAPGEAPGPLSLTDSDTQRAVEALFGERFGAAALAGEKQSLKAKPEAERQAALTDRLYRQLLEKEPLAPTALPKLAQERAQAMASYVAQTQQLPASRLKVVEPAEAVQASEQVVASKLNLSATP